MIGSYELVQHAAVVHDHLCRPLYPERFPSLPWSPPITTRLATYTRSTARYRVALVAISQSHACRHTCRSTPWCITGSTRTILPEKETGIRRLLDAWWQTGVHRAITAARGRNSAEDRRQDARALRARAFPGEFVQPHLGDDVIYLGEVDADASASCSWGCSAAEPNQLAGASMAMLESPACGTPVGLPPKVPFRDRRARVTGFRRQRCTADRWPLSFDQIDRNVCGAGASASL